MNSKPLCPLLVVQQQLAEVMVNRPKSANSGHTEASSNFEFQH